MNNISILENRGHVKTTTKKRELTPYRSSMCRREFLKQSKVIKKKNQAFKQANCKINAHKDVFITVK